MEDRESKFSIYANAVERQQKHRHPQLRQKQQRQTHPQKYAVILVCIYSNTSEG